MDNHLTPNKIQRLMHLAEDKSFSLSRRLLLTDDELKRVKANQEHISKSTVNCESSSGILDLDQVEAFGESGVGNESLRKSTAFNPGEMTGRSTGTEEISNNTMPLGRHSLALDSITSQMNKQSSEVHDLMRHSISNTTTYSFHSKRDLTADEASLIMREAPLPILPSSMQAQFTDSVSLNRSNLSVGAYFQKRCPEFGRILEKTDSPDRSAYSAMPSITEVASLTPEQMPAPIPQKYTMDESLDCVPVRQSRLEKSPEKLNTNNPGMGKNYEKQSFHSTASKKNNNTYNKVTEHNYTSISAAPEPQKYHFPITLNPVASSSFAYHDTFKTPCQPSDMICKTTGQPSDMFFKTPGQPSDMICKTTGQPSDMFFKTPGQPSDMFFKTPGQPSDVFIRDMESSLRLVTHDTEGSACPSENSLSISKIADYLGKESLISVSGILKYNNKNKLPPKKQPLTELHLNLQESKKKEEMHVTNLKDTKNMDTASSAGTVNTVISLEKLKISQEKEIPSVVVTSYTKTDALEECKDKKLSTRSKSPSSKSQSTLSTVHENFTSFKSGDSPLHISKGDISNTHVPSPNIDYRELDKSVDWHEVLQQKRLKEEGLAKEKWADVLASDANGFVGVSCAVNITITTLTDSWLTAKLQFDNLPNEGKDLTIELPRLPLLLSPGKSEQITVHVTSNVEMNTKLSYTIFLKDASIDGDIEQKESLDVHIKKPMIQAMSCDGMNKVTFLPTQEKHSLMKSLVLINDCPVDLQLVLSIVEGESIFTINNVQEIKKGDVNKVLMDRQGSLEDGQQGKAKTKGMNKQLCRLSNGNAIRIAIKFNAPKLSDLEIEESLVTFNGVLNVNLIGVNAVLRKVDLVGVVGTVNLVVQLPETKLQLTNEPTNIPLCNKGSIPGVWVVKLANPSTDSYPFKVAPSRFDIRPGGYKQIGLCYTGPDDSASEATLIFEELSSGHKTAIEISGGTEKPKSFPIRTNHNILSFVRSGRKELSLKNSTNNKIHIRCHLVGDGFSIDLPGMESRGIYCLPFGPLECRPLPIMFSPISNIPHSATLHLVFDKNSDFSRTVKLYGCSSGESMRWSGLVTYGETALVRAVCREPINLELFNKNSAPAFVCARVHFNLQYQSVSASARLAGARRVVRGRARHALSLSVEWARVERRARDAATAALATITVLTGAELTRRRILRVLRDETSGALDTSILDDHLKVLAGPFEGEDPNMENMLADFKETKTSLNELIGGLHELTAQIVLPQDFADENTIIITDDTVVEHHTLCD